MRQQTFKFCFNRKLRRKKSVLNRQIDKICGKINYQEYNKIHTKLIIQTGVEICLRF